MTRSAFFAALITVCSWLSVPIGDIAFTLQTLGIFLSLTILGGKWGSVSILIYLLLGAMGLPVFSSFRGGIGMLLGATGGDLWGFALGGLVYRLLERFGSLPGLIAAQLVCYVCGTAWFAMYSGGGIGFVLLRCVVPFLIPDFLKIWLTLYLKNRLKSHIQA